MRLACPAAIRVRRTVGLLSAVDGAADSAQPTTRSSLAKKRDPQLAVEQRVDARERLDRRPRGGVEAPVVVAVAPRSD